MQRALQFCLMPFARSADVASKRVHALIDWHSDIEELAAEDAPDDDPTADYVAGSSLCDIVCDISGGEYAVVQEGTPWLLLPDDVMTLGPVSQFSTFFRNPEFSIERFHSPPPLAGPAEPPEEQLELITGVTIDGKWYNCKEEFFDDAKNFTDIEPDEETAVECRACEGRAAWLQSLQEWRREGRADSTAKLAALGMTVVESVPLASCCTKKNQIPGIDGHRHSWSDSGF